MLELVTILTVVLGMPDGVVSSVLAILGAVN